MSFIKSVTLMKKICNSINAEKSETIGSRTGFIKRFKDEGIKAISFIKTLVIGTTEMPKVTLETLGMKISEYQGIESAMTKQAVSQKMQVGKRLLGQYLKDMLYEGISVYNIKSYNKIMEKFKDVRIYDATIISLPKGLKEVYTGLGGTNAQSALKVQSCYSLKEKIVKDMDITAAVDNDSLYTEIIVKRGNKEILNIVDMGYIDADEFDKMGMEGGYYLTRCKQGKVIYEYTKNSLKRANLVEELSKVENQGGFEKEYLIYGKKKVAIPVRIIAIRLPEEKASLKVMKAQQKFRKKGRELSNEERILLRYEIFMTNIPENMLTLDEICELYRLRWQGNLALEIPSSDRNNI